ncbi:MAG: penicillin acylase family protein [Saprospiraceae bacterium]|nr:penicillin acylase family protein [Saprospiraceae bacterium]
MFFIFTLNKSHTTGSPQKTIFNTDGSKTIVESTERFIPPMGKLLSPSHGFWQNAEGAIPSFNNIIKNKFLSSSVKVQYDNRLVPHIFGDNISDVIFAQGYVTASLRLWQMELQTHAAAGRLTEILGTTDKLKKILIEKDKLTRRIGIPLGARNAINEWSKRPEEFKVLDAYTAGVNAYINTLSYSELPLLYKLQDYYPEKWTNLKSALMMKSMGRTLTGRNHDFQLTALLKQLGLEKFNSLYGDYFEEQSPIILEPVKINNPVVINEEEPIGLYLGKLDFDSLSINYSPKGVGSNNWAVSGSKTASGNPILCNDPHLKLNLPSIWFEVQLYTPEFNSYGASLPGAPGVISGFNENIAWGVTNVGHDVRDWYAIQWKDKEKQFYWFDSTFMQSEIVVEQIKVRGSQTILDTILMTHIGPIAHSSNNQDFALRWTLHDPSEEPLTFLKLMKGKNYADYKDAIKHFACPAQNIVFAAKNGDIALWTQGKLPIRKKMQGKFVQQGNSSKELWQGYIPQEHIPHEYNPNKKFVASANQHSINPNNYPYEFYGYFEEYRGRYLNRRLAEMENITVKDMMDLQFDSYSQKAEDFMSLLKKYLKKGDLHKNELEIWHILKDWDYKFTGNQIEPTVFEIWFDSLRTLIYDEIFALSENDNFLKKENIKLPEQFNLLNLMKRDIENPIFDIVNTKKIERIDDIITLAFKKTCSKFKYDISNILPWKKYRSTVVQHLSKVPAFSFDSIDTDGHRSALNALDRRPGPSWKMVVELGNNINAYGIYPGGQSENPGSFYYSNMIDKWAKGEHYKLLFMKDSQKNSDQIICSQDFIH